MNADARERIGIYRIVRRLGSGGMGEVFLAYDERLDRLVAIKRVRPEAAGDAERRERLRREARAAARLSHPNVVQVFDLIEDEEGDSIVFEYVQGRTAAHLLRDGPLAPGTAAGIAGQVAEGLAAAHAAGLVHRDLKGENVVVTPEGRAKILDFGLVKPLDPVAMGTAGTLTEGGAVLGTWRAMSPEQASGEPVDARSDLFSLGVLLYEMLAGRSPFAGRSPAEVLRNVLAAAPVPLEELRPEVPAELTGLVRALLARDPARRPSGAVEVAAALRGFGGLPGGSGVVPAGIGDFPTSAGGTAPPAPRLEEPLATDRRPESLSRALAGPRGWRRAAAVLAVAVAAGVAAIPAIPWLRGAAAPEPLRVAVLAPAPLAEASADGEALALAASGTVVASLRGLLALEGVTAVEPAQIGKLAGGHGGAVAAARSVAADEALTAALGREGPAGSRAGSLSLRRIRTQDGSVLWAERLPVPLGPEDALVLATAVEAAVRRAYPERRPLAGQADLEVRAEDYAELIRIKQRLDAGRGAWAPELARLEAVTAGSPRFAEAHLQAAALALNLYSDNQEAAHLARARTSLERARAVSAGAAGAAGAPADPRLLAVEIRLALVERRWDRAEELLAELEERSPGDVLVLIQRSRLAEARGRLDEAIELLREVVARRPAWRDLVRLAELEIRRGDVPAARGHLEQASGLVPGNDWPLAKLGELELLYGEPRRAESIYRRLAAAPRPQRSDLTNLGLARALLGDFAGAAESYRRALEVEPGHTTATLNLADAELALGNAETARRLYAGALAGLEARQDGSPLQPVDRTVRAQCLARLGRGREAVALALETFQAHPGDAEVALQTALVLTLAGDDAAALAAAGQALDLGIRPRWFSLPGFERLRADPDLRRRLAADLP